MAKLVIEICVGTSCHLLGSGDLFSTVCELSAAQKENVEIKGVSCLGKCGQGPNVRVNGVILSGVTPDKLLKIIECG